MLRGRPGVRAPPPRRAGPAIPGTPGLQVGTWERAAREPPLPLPPRPPEGERRIPLTQNGGRHTWGRRHPGKPAAAPRLGLSRHAPRTHLSRAAGARRRSANDYAAAPRRRRCRRRPRHAPLVRSPPSLRRRDALAPRRAHRGSPRPAGRPASCAAAPLRREPPRPRAAAARWQVRAVRPSRTSPAARPLGRAVLKSDLGLARNRSE